MPHKIKLIHYPLDKDDKIFLQERGAILHGNLCTFPGDPAGLHCVCSLLETRFPTHPKYILLINSTIGRRQALLSIAELAASL